MGEDMFAILALGVVNAHDFEDSLSVGAGIDNFAYFAFGAAFVGVNPRYGVFWGRCFATTIIIEFCERQASRFEPIKHETRMIMIAPFSTSRPISFRSYPTITTAIIAAACETLSPKITRRSVLL